MSVIESVSKLPLRWSWIHACLSVESKSNHITLVQGGITCGAIEEASISSKTIDKHVIINYREKMPNLHAFATKMMYDKKDFSFV